MSPEGIGSAILLSDPHKVFEKNKVRDMKNLILLLIMATGPAVFAQGFSLGDLVEEAPVVEEAPAQEVAPKRRPKPPVDVVVTQPAVDKYKNFRCNAGKFVNRSSVAGPLNDAEDLIIDIVGIGKPLNRKLVQADTNDPRRPKRDGETFALSGQRGILELGMPKGLFGAWVWVPAKLCVSNSGKLMAHIDASEHKMGTLQVEIKGHGPDTFQMVGGTSDGKIKFNGIYRREMSEVSR